MSFIGKRYGRGGAQIVEALGDATATPPPPTFHDIANGEFVSTVSAIALTYHGYKRTGSLVWALLYGLAGKQFPIEAVPIVIAQGYGQKKPCP